MADPPAHTDGPAPPPASGPGEDELRRELDDARRRVAALEDALARAVRVRDHPLSRLSHDLKNPMSALLLGVQRLSRFSDEARRPQAQALSEKLERTLRGMNRQVEVLVDLARLDAGALRLDLRPEPLWGLAARALAQLAPLAAEKGQTLDLAPDPGAPKVSCDPERIVHVIANLVGNAVRFADAGSAIRVAVRHEGQELVCSVSDAGPGIAPDSLPLLFDRHWHPTDGSSPSHGLGLPVVKGYVAAHGGRVWVHSELGRGSTFSFALPVG